jgi:hypothetical protein
MCYIITITHVFSQGVDLIIQQNLLYLQRHIHYILSLKTHTYWWKLPISQMTVYRMLYFSFKQCAVNSATSIFNNMIIQFCSYVTQASGMTRFTQLVTIWHTPTKKFGTEPMAVALGKGSLSLLTAQQWTYPDNTNGMHTSGAVLYKHL